MTATAGSLGTLDSAVASGRDTTEPSVLGTELVDLNVYTDHDSLTRELRQADGVRRKREAGLLWFVQHGPTEGTPCLFLGVRGSVGAVQWFDADSDGEIPAEGSSEKWIDYFTPHGDHTSMPPGSELPLDHIFEILREFTRTEKKPTLIEWAPEPPIRTEQVS